MRLKIIQPIFIFFFPKFVILENTKFWPTSICIISQTKFGHDLLVLDPQIVMVNKANITEINDCGTQEDKFLQVWSKRYEKACNPNLKIDSNRNAWTFINCCSIIKLTRCNLLFCSSWDKRNEQQNWNVMTKKKKKTWLMEAHNHISSQLRPLWMQWEVLHATVLLHF